MKQLITTVVNLAGEDVYTYMDCTPEQALITQHLLDNKQASQIHSIQARARIRKLILVNRITLSIGDLSVMQENYNL